MCAFSMAIPLEIAFPRSVAVTGAKSPLALGEALVAVVVAQARLVGVAVAVGLEHLLEHGGELGEGILSVIFC